MSHASHTSAWGKACIIAGERCNDRGECAANLHHAKIAVTDGMESMERFRYRIALPAPSLYGQFKNLQSIDRLLDALINIGFDDVFEVARGADMVTEATRRLCRLVRQAAADILCLPGGVRLIRVRFPASAAHIQHRLAHGGGGHHRPASSLRGVSPDEIGVFFITPCAAKMTSVMNPLGRPTTGVDGTISIVDIFGVLNAQLGQADMKRHGLKAHALPAGVGWAATGGEGEALGRDSHLSVDGIHNIIRMFEEVENGKFSDLKFIEALACTGGCLGGPLTFENSYVAKMRLAGLIANMPRGQGMSEADIAFAHSDRMYLSEPIEPLPVERLDSDIGEAIKKLERVNALSEILPGLDCGSCGSPNCRTLAEDIVRGDAVELDCIFLLKNKVAYLANEMVKLASVDHAFDQPEQAEGGPKPKERG